MNRDPRPAALAIDLGCEGNDTSLPQPAEPPLSGSLGGPPLAAPFPLGLLLGALLLAALACGPAASAGDDERSGAAGEAPSEAPGAAGPVVIELFTSQGCSSCPPADRLLARLDADPELGPRLLPLAFHVDYWNSIGWRDPFSSERWSRRQERYAQTLEAGRLYTPQLVVAGREHCVGSRASEVRELIDEALAREPPARVAIEGVELAGDRLTVRAGAELVPGAGVTGAQELLVALVESGLATKIQSGENAHRTLANERVVRRLERVLTLEPGARETGEASVAFALEPGWRTDELAVVAFLQDRDSLHIHAAAEGKVEP